MRDEESNQNRNLAMTDTHAPDAAPDKAEEPAPEKGTPTEARPPSADPTVALNEEIASLKDRLLRALAEMENLRRRTEREVADARLYGITQFARDVVTVADNMERALQALDAEIREKAEPGVKALLDGVELTERELIKALEKHGVQKLDPMGQKFDPHRHQAMFEVPDPSVPAGTVVQVVQSGYSIGERVLRPAMVGIAKGGPKAPPPGEAAAEAPANDNAGASPGTT
jgi:molecular chaperone GrpE